MEGWAVGNWGGGFKLQLGAEVWGPSWGRGALLFWFSGSETILNQGGLVIPTKRGSENQSD